MNYHNNYVYLLIEREFIKSGENVYKIGLTKQKELMRFSQYPKGSDLLLHSMCNNCRVTEKEIMKQFKQHFIQRNDYGTEYFEGNYKHMVYLIHTIIANEYKNDFINISKENNINPNYVVDNNDNDIKHNKLVKQFYCEKCEYKTERKNNFVKHLNSNIHKKYFHSINDNKILNYKCLSCEYIFSRKSNYNRHIKKCNTKECNTFDSTNNRIASSTKIIAIQDTISEKNQEHTKNIYNCEKCGFTTIKKRNYQIHLNSKKHIQNMKQEQIKMVDTNANIELFKNEVISTMIGKLSSVLEQNNKNILAEQTKILMDVKSNNITNNKINNQQFNMNLFLNETCKDAMNLSEFLENMHVSMEDMEKTGEIGFAKGMSRIIMNNLNTIDVCKRPIHCSDVKRETIYVKNNGVWEKETEDRKITKEIIYKVYCLNVHQLFKWHDFPNNKESHHINIVTEINKMMEEIEMVITSICKYVAIDKEKVKRTGYLN
jgi:hypothetical protein